MTQSKIELQNKNYYIKLNLSMNLTDNLDELNYNYLGQFNKENIDFDVYIFKVR